MVADLGVHENDAALTIFLLLLGEKAGMRADVYWKITHG
jgi:hypothetical protein